MSLLSAEQIELLALQPVPGDHPAGENVRLESQFEDIEQEIAKLDALSIDHPVRWTLISENAQTILAQQSKDFLVVCYLTRALCETDLVSGLNQGLRLAYGVADTYWDHAFPPKKRVRGRAQAFEWLAEKCHPLLQEYRPRPRDLDAIKELEDTVVVLDELLLEKMHDAAPNLAEFRQTFRRMREALEAQQSAQSKAQPDVQPRVDQGAAVKPPARPQAVQTPAPTPASSVGNDRELMAAYRAAQDPLRLASQYLSAKNALDPEIYRINRFITWLGVSQLPPAVNNKTQIRPVAKDKLDRLLALRQEQNWQQLVLEIEPSLARAPFWLDGQRYACEALEALAANEAADAVKAGVSGFVNRLPGVDGLTFFDDTPYADSATRQWIQQISRAESHSGGSNSLTVDTADLSPRWLESYELAQQMVVEKRIPDALNLFQDGVAQSTSLREQSLWRLNQARLCFDAGLKQLALPLLEALDHQLVESGVEQWEPQMTKRVIELLLRCYRSLDANEQTQAKMEHLHTRLCRLDLALAFELIT